MVKPPITAGIKELKVSPGFFCLHHLLTAPCASWLFPVFGSSLGRSGSFYSPSSVKRRWLGGSPYFSFAVQWVFLFFLFIYLQLICVSWPVSHRDAAFHFQTLQIDWTGATNILDSPAFGLVSPISCCDAHLSSLIPPLLFQRLLRGHGREHRCLPDGAAQPYVLSPHRPGQNGPDAVPPASRMWHSTCSHLVFFNAL